ncbi:MAG TPA: hypothetical protein PKX15_06045 [Bacteroidales bacterium]|jgi:hypothetical protein|nr:hypothetical protein [Bacteroidales bacterium]HOS16551.1 hypothetical protein [Bacteroidales bacterium]
MQKDPETNKWTYSYTFKVSKEKRREIETCAKKNHMTVNKFIKDSIDLHLTLLKQKPKKNDILKNQLELF